MTTKNAMRREIKQMVKDAERRKVAERWQRKREREIEAKMSEIETSVRNGSSASGEQTGG